MIIWWALRMSVIITKGMTQLFDYLIMMIKCPLIFIHWYVPTLNPLSGEVIYIYHNPNTAWDPPSSHLVCLCLRLALLKASALPQNLTGTRTTPSHGGRTVDQTSLFHQGMETAVLCCHLVFGDWSFRSWGLQSGTSLDQTCSGSTHRRLTWWDLENLESRLMLFVTFIEPFLSSFCSEAEHTVLLGGPLPSGIGDIVFEWVMVCVKCSLVYHGPVPGAGPALHYKGLGPQI